MMLEDVVRRAGLDVCGTAATIAQANVYLEGTLPDAAVLALKLAHGELSYPLAIEFKRLKIPFVVITGFSTPCAVRFCTDGSVMGRHEPVHELFDRLVLALARHYCDWAPGSMSALSQTRATSACDKRRAGLVAVHL
jgi:hypothetical protein